ncbi:acyltransferase [Cellulomonas sp. DKR-3]|uniref:Acyltransferase n=1 Tax=Cellulomonas fulva TaxID=2835530 RepID=A0ABS5TZP3_9CELL|nr:acyltransferase family protein [Cellulomonas fulva]MBT0994591.1 acyltransferase [Cellulomonas fulva]
MTSAGSLLDQQPAPSGGRPGHRTRQLRRDVQGLRAVAVLAVIADHVLGWPHGGFVGVDVFFVISGYLITGLLLREHARTGSISFRGFYARRVRRIMPNAILTLVVTVGATAVLIGGDRLVATVKDAVAAALTVVNWRFAVQGTDYFAQGLPPSPVQHFWSLSVEEQFYFVWPWLMLGLLALAARRASARSGRVRRTWVLGIAMGVVVVVSFAWALHQTADQPSFAYFSTLTRVWELGVGALAAIGAARVARWLAARPGWWRPVLAWSGLAAIAVSLLVVRSDHGFPAPWALLPVAATALVIMAGEGAGTSGPWLLTNRPMNYVGDASYSLYLWHWPVVVLLPALLPEDSAWFGVLAVAIGVALALPAYHLVENPARGAHPGHDAQGRRRHPLRNASVAAVAMAAVVVGGCGATVAVLENARQPAQASPVGSQEECFGALTLAHRALCDGVVFTDPVTPDPQDAESDMGGAYECYSAQDGPAKPCTRGDLEGDVRVAVVGNSHAAALLPGLLPEAERLGWKVDVLVGFGCNLTTTPNPACPGTSAEIEQRLLHDEPYDLVVTTSSRSTSGADNPARVPGMRDMMDQVTARGTAVAAISDAPMVTDEALACAARVGADLDTCGMPRDEAFAVRDPLREPVRESQDAELVDVTDLYCRPETCPVVIGGVLAYRDTAGHTTATYSKTLGPIVVERIRSATGV